MHTVRVLNPLGFSIRWTGPAAPVSQGEPWLTHSQTSTKNALGGDEFHNVSDAHTKDGGQRCDGSFETPPRAGREKALGASAGGDDGIDPSPFAGEEDPWSAKTMEELQVREASLG